MFKYLSGLKSPRALRSVIVLLPALVLTSGMAQAHIYRTVDASGTTIFTDVKPMQGRWEIIVRDKPAAVPNQSAQDPHRYAVQTPSRYASQIQAAALAHNVDAALIHAVITAESGYNPSAVSRAGAVGLMQLMPQTASRYNVTDSRDPGQNISGGVRYLRDLLQMFNNDLHLTIAAYNAGEQAVMKYGNRIPPYRETVAYVPKVMKFYERYRTGYASKAPSGNKRVVTAATKKGTQARVSRTYMVSRAATGSAKAHAG